MPYLASTEATLYTINTLQAFHPPHSSILSSNFWMEFQLDADLDFFLDYFRSAFDYLPHLSIGRPIGMVCEHLQGSLNCEDFVNARLQLSSYVITSHIHGSIA
jgi:hypothetical protein